MPRLKILIIIVFVAINGFGQTYDIVGPGRSESFGSFLTLLPNGNYVVCDPGFDDSLLLNVGAVYLFDGKTNSIISSIKGSSSGDEVGDGGIKVLTNGNYVISSENCQMERTEVQEPLLGVMQTLVFPDLLIAAIHWWEVRWTIKLVLMEESTF